ncbi:MAG: DUF559 domain-containing protein [Nitrosarchaeum sp.]|nr:DUF559 domain-containing protein [Nitrosarchaeum sp.]
MIQQLKTVLELYKSGLTIHKLHELGYSRKITNLAIPKSERRGPKDFRHTEESKKKLSISASKWLKTRVNHPWRKHQESYPEKIMKEWLSKNITNHQIIQEYTPVDFDKNYRMDFAIVDLKIDIEINGNVHYEDRQYKRLKSYYVEREQYIISKGWRVINILARDIVKNFNDVIYELKQHMTCELSSDSITIQVQKQIVINKLEDNFKKIVEMIYEGSTLNDVSKMFNVKYKKLQRFLLSKNINCKKLHSAKFKEERQKMIEVKKLSKEQKKEQKKLSKEQKEKERLIEKNNIRNQKRNQKDQLRQVWINKRIEDIKHIDKEWGYVSKLANLWNISHTQVRRFLQEYSDYIKH